MKTVFVFVWYNRVTSQDSIHKCIQNAYTIAVKRIFPFHRPNNRPTPKSMSAGDLTRKLTALPHPFAAGVKERTIKGRRGSIRTEREREKLGNSAQLAVPPLDAADWKVGGGELLSRPFKKSRPRPR